MDYVTIALPKGKLYEPSVQLLEKVGLGCPLQEDARQLVYVDETNKVRYIMTRPTDVPTYVEHGAADLGIVGKDVLLESPKEVYELLDLKFGFCRLVLAMPKEQATTGFPNGYIHIRVATKFPNITEQYLYQKGMPAEVILLHGSIELAPRVGLADAIVDIVSTGTTLRENNLVEVEEIARATARLIANRVSFNLKADRIGIIVAELGKVLEQESQGI